VNGSNTTAKHLCKDCPSIYWKETGAVRYNFTRCDLSRSIESTFCDVSRLIDGRCPAMTCTADTCCVDTTCETGSSIFQACAGCAVSETKACAACTIGKYNSDLSAFHCSECPQGERISKTPFSPLHSPPLPLRVRCNPPLPSLILPSLFTHPPMPFPSLLPPPPPPHPIHAPTLPPQ
jgi:hypothetical protein